jgi:vacuolar-type H+-ATPase subunit E/Vma4
VKTVEAPHMKRLYGDTIRTEDGIETAIKEIVKEEAAKLKRKGKELEDKVKKIRKDLSEDLDKLSDTVKSKINKEVSDVKSKMQRFKTQTVTPLARKVKNEFVKGKDIVKQKNRKE